MTAISAPAGSAATNLAADDSAMPGTIVPGQTITVTTRPNDSFGSVLDRRQAQGARW